MLYLIFILFAITLSIIYYIIKNRDCKLSMYFLGVIGILSLFELSIFIYYAQKGETVCQTTKRLIC